MQHANHAIGQQSLCVHVSSSQGDLIQQTVGHSCPGQAWDGWLVRHCGQKNIKIIFEQHKIPRVFISEAFWQQVEQPCTMYTKWPLPCFLHHGWSIAGDSVRDCHSDPPITILPIEWITLNQPLAELPQETYLIPLTPPFLRVDSQGSQVDNLPSTHTACFQADESRKDANKQPTLPLTPPYQLVSIFASWDLTDFG